MPMKLYAHPDNYKTYKALIAAKYVGLEVETPGGSDTAQTGKIPVLETNQGCIFSSTAIARYISRISRPVGLYGQTILEGGMIDSWIEFCTHELEVPLCTWVLPVLGIFDEVPEATACAKQDVKLALAVLNNHLLHNTYVVGHQITLADISVCCALVDGMRLVLDAEFRKPFGNLMRWFNLCLSQPEFAAIIGKVDLCGKAAQTAAANKETDKKPKKESAPKETAPKREATPKREVAPEKETAREKKKAAPKKGASKKESNGKDKVPEEAEPTVEDLEKAMKDKLKTVIKEGGKRGVEIEGAADMGGLQFFCTAVELPDGDEELLVESMKAMNAKSDPTEEERKGGSGHIGKMIFSAGTEQLAVVAYVPEEKQSVLSCGDWLKAVIDSQNGEIVSSSADICVGRVRTNAEKGIFPLKIRESMILEANNFLRKEGLFPEDNGDDDDYVFGDDDFPS